MAWSVAAAIGVPTAAAHVLELLQGVVTEVTVQLPLPGEIWPNCRGDLGNNGYTSCRPGGYDGHRGRQEKERGDFLDHVCLDHVCPTLITKITRTPHFFL